MLTLGRFHCFTCHRYSRGPKDCDCLPGAQTSPCNESCGNFYYQQKIDDFDKGLDDLLDGIRCKAIQDVADFVRDEAEKLFFLIGPILSGTRIDHRQYEAIALLEMAVKIREMTARQEGEKA